MTKHKHADLMLKYAQIAMESNTPWDRFEYAYRVGWSPLERHPLWDNKAEYRLKPKTIRIGEYDVPEPVRDPLEINDSYFTLDIGNASCINSMICESDWNNDEIDLFRLNNGLIHLTLEAAEIHMEALISFTKNY